MSKKIYTHFMEDQRMKKLLQGDYIQEVKELKNEICLWWGSGVKHPGFTKYYGSRRQGGWVYEEK